MPNLMLAPVPYTETPNKVRIFKDPEESGPWQVDGVDTRAGKSCGTGHWVAYTELCLHYPTFDDAVAHGIDAIIACYTDSGDHD